ncbi:MAG: hypothetical protein WKG07_43405 [Hymenobacter sp.]
MAATALQHGRVAGVHHLRDGRAQQPGVAGGRGHGGRPGRREPGQ